jgi:hypothetical protein
MPSCGMWRRAGPVRTYVSEERIASILRLEKFCERRRSLVIGHTNLYLNARFHHHPYKKQAVLSTLVHRTRARLELVFFRDVFRQNGYKDRQIHNVLNRRPDISKLNISPAQPPSFPMLGLCLAQSA